MLLVALAWNPRSGGGLDVFFSRYLFSIGLPVEKWLHVLAELLQVEARPERFLRRGGGGAAARAVGGRGALARRRAQRTSRAARTPHAVDYASSELALTIYSRYRLGPALRWHLHLLGQLLGEFYVAKLREEKLRQASYLQAVHETGARMTHDIKNLLQSLSVLSSVAARDERRATRRELQALLRRQLPLIERRLSETLEKLQRPQEGGENYVGRAPVVGIARAPVPRRRASSSSRPTPPPGVRLPRSLFDSVADNLIRNALAKRAGDADAARARRARMRRARRAARLRQRRGGARGDRRSAAARAGALAQRPGHRPVPGGAPGRGERLSPGAGIEPRRRSLLRADRNAGLGQHAGRDQPAVELPDRDPQQQVVVLAAGRARRARRRARRRPRCC